MAQADARARAAAERKEEGAACGGHARFRGLEGGVPADEGGQEVDRAAARPGGGLGEACSGLLRVMCDLSL